jgi:hypothetical protein
MNFTKLNSLMTTTRASLGRNLTAERALDASVITILDGDTPLVRLHKTGAVDFGITEPTQRTAEVITQFLTGKDFVSVSGPKPVIHRGEKGTTTVLPGNWYQIGPKGGLKKKVGA